MSALRVDRRRTVGEDGQTVMGLVLPVLLLMLLGIAEFGQLAGTFLSLQGAAWTAARVAAAGVSDIQIEQRVLQAAPYLDAQRLDVTVSPPGRLAHGDRLRVSVSYAVPVGMPLLAAITGNPFHLTAVAYRQIE
jgi:Flp pilus assembly protein TadG